MRELSTEAAIAELRSRTGVQYSAEQEAILRAKGGMRILACAGSGKTTILTHLVAKRILTGEIDPDKTLCTTFSKQGAREISKRLEEILQCVNIFMAGIQCRTMHSVYLELIKHFRGEAIEIIPEVEQYKILDEVGKKCRKSFDNDTKRGLLGVFSYCTNNLTEDISEVGSGIEEDLGYTEAEIREIREEYTAIKRERGQIDYDDMQVEVYNKVVTESDKEWIGYCQEKWEHMYIDEFQDTSEIQYRILKAISKDLTEVVVIGDDDQSIYEWRGTNPRLMQTVKADAGFNSYSLSTNYRCGEKIVELAAEGIEQNAVRVQKELRGNTRGGKYYIQSVAEASDILGASIKCLKDIKSILSDEEKVARAEDIAVLVRNNTHIEVLSILLQREGIPTQRIAEKSNSRGSAALREIGSVLELADEMVFNRDTVKLALRSLLGYRGQRATQYILKVMEDLCIDFRSALGYYVSPDAVEIKNSTVANVLARQRESINEVQELREIYAKYKSGIEQGELAIEMLKMYGRTIESTKEGKDQARTKQGLYSLLKKLIEVDGYVSTRGLIDVITSVKEQGNTQQVSGVTLSTIHSAKGMEWRYVIMLGDDGIGFPNIEMLQNRLKTASNKQRERKRISRELDEGRRLHYVGITRAKEELYIITASDRPSVYLLESTGRLKIGNRGIITLLGSSDFYGGLYRNQRAVQMPE